MRWGSHVGLLVAGWYLITPPFVGGNINRRAPLSQWDEEAHFPSLGDCSDERDRYPLRSISRKPMKSKQNFATL